MDSFNEESKSEALLSEKPEPNERKEITLTGVVLATALKTTALFLSLIVLFVTVLSFIHPNTANVYYRMNLYEKAARTAERDFERKQRALNDMFADSEEYSGYFKNKYIPSLIRTVDYSIAWFNKTGNSKKNAAFVSKYSQIYLEKADWIFSYNNVDIVNMNMLPDYLKVYSYNYRAKLKYYMIKSAAVLGDEELLAERIEQYFTADMYSTLEQSKQNGKLNEIFAINYIPDWSMGGYINTMLDVVDYRYPTSVLKGFFMENVRNTFNPAKYSHMTFRYIYNKSDGYTIEYKRIKSVYNNLKEIRAGQNFSAMTKVEDKLLYLWYDRTISDISNTMASVLNIIWVMNSNTAGLSDHADSQIQEYVAADKESWTEMSEKDYEKFREDNLTL